jgi:hypothetical protein
MSFLSAIGKDFKAVFAWLGSAKGQAIVATTEGAAVAIATPFGLGPAIAGAETLFNSWLAEVVKTETLAAAADQQTGSGVQKAAAVIAAMTPQAITFAQHNGLAAPTAESLQTINTSVVAVLNALGAPANAPAA